jgi:hypothetical protein
MMGGEASVMKVIFTNILVGLVGVLLYYQFPAFSGVLTLVALLFIYSLMFRLSFFRAFLAWIIQGILAFVLFVLAVMVFGIPVSLAAVS